MTNPTVDVTDHGATGDGTTNDRDAIQTAANTLGPNGGCLLFPPGTYRTTGRILVTGDDITIQGTGNPTIVGAFNPQTNPTPLLVTAGNRIEIDGIRLHRTDTPNDYDTLYPLTNLENYAALFLATSTQTVVRDVHTAGSIIGIAMQGSPRARIENVHHTGLGATTQYANYTAGIFVETSDDVTITGYHCDHTGNGILVGGNSDGTKIIGVTITNSRDNGVYVSSGNRATITDTHILGTGNTGIKTRGSHHTITGNIIEDTVVGILVSGATIPIDGTWGAQGCTVEGNRVTRTVRAGIYLTQQGSTGLYPRDTQIVGNTLRAVVTDGSYTAGIYCHGDLATITGNQIHDYRGTMAPIGIRGAGKSPNPHGYMITGNTLNGRPKGIPGIHTHPPLVGSIVEHNIGT